ncbi:MAG: DNA polymerase III subunit gamma/tau [Deltaproteobacteria bacterium]|nr:DNA polymerase III subunit gamma/tau [Deltaproteobacteria bacterium]
MSSYLVLARKYRPQTFEEIVGQEHITNTLQSAIQLGRVAHAYMFSGSRGTGKTSIARIFAKALNCLENSNGIPCNRCESCVEITRSTGVDVIELDAASNRGKEDAEQLREAARFAPARGKYKIFVIDEAHMLTNEASNALLKVLEEPPPHVIFMFATTEPHKMLETIRSRCQRFQFRRLPVQVQVDQLARVTGAEGLRFDAEALKVIARESQGGMRDSLALVDLIASSRKDSAGAVTADEVTALLGLADRDLLWRTVNGVLTRSSAQILEVVETVYSYGLDVKDFHSRLLWMLRNAIVVKSVKMPGDVLDLTTDEIERLRELTENHSLQHLDHLFQICQRAEDTLARTSHPRAVLEVTLVRMAELPEALASSELAGLVSGGPPAAGVPGQQSHNSTPSPAREAGGRPPATASANIPGAEILNRWSNGNASRRPAVPAPAPVRASPPERQANSTVRDGGDRRQAPATAAAKPAARTPAVNDLARTEPAVRELIEVAEPVDIRIRNQNED